MQQIWDGFRREFAQLWAQAVAEGRGGDLALGSLYGHDAPAGHAALEARVTTTWLCRPDKALRLAASPSESQAEGLCCFSARASGAGRMAAVDNAGQAGANKCLTLAGAGAAALP